MSLQINATTPDLRRPISRIAFPCTVMHGVEQIAARGNQLYTVSSRSDGLRFYRISFESSMPPPEGFPQLKFDWDHAKHYALHLPSYLIQDRPWPALPFFMVQDRLCLFETSFLSCRDIERPAADDSDKLVLGAGKIVAAMDHLGCVIQLVQRGTLKFCLFADTAPQAFENLYLHWESIGKPGQPKDGSVGWYEKCSISLLRFDKNAAFGISETKLKLPKWSPDAISGPFTVSPDSQTRITARDHQILYGHSSRLESSTEGPPTTITGCQLRGNVLASILDGSLVTWNSLTMKIIKVLTPNSLHLTDSVTLVDFRLLEGHLILLDSAQTLTVYPLFQDPSVSPQTGPTRSICIATDKAIRPTTATFSPTSYEEQQALVKAQQLIEEEARPNKTDMIWCWHRAAIDGHASVAELLIKAGVSLHARDERNKTSLHLAAENGHADVVELLIKAKADLNKTDMRGQTPLYIAAENGHADVVELLIEGQANLNAKHENNSTPLHMAAENGHADVVELLIKAKANLNETDSDDNTPLHLAASKGHTNVIELLIKTGGTTRPTTATFPPISDEEQQALVEVQQLIKSGAELDNRDERGKTPLISAAENGHANVVTLLTDTKANLNETDMRGKTPVHIAAENGHANVVELLIKAGANPDRRLRLPARPPRRFPGPRNPRRPEIFGYTPMHLAANKGHANVVALLIEGQANLNAKYENNSTPLHMAAENGHADVVALLIEKRADFNAEDGHGMTPMHLAAKNEHTDIVELLTKAKAELNTVDQFANMPLHHAAYYGNTATAKRLIEAGANLSTTNENLHTPLHIAARNGHADVVTLLIAADTNLNIIANANFNPRLPCGLNQPLYLATQNGHADVVTLLITAGANLNATGEKRMTPLHIAARNGHATVVALLIGAKANLNATDESLGSPLHCAALRGHATVAALLIEARANLNPKNTAWEMPLHIAAKEGHTNVAELLIGAKAALNEKDIYNTAPMHYAALRGHAAIVELLIEAKADPNATGKESMTPLHFAAYHGHAAIVKRLIKAGANLNATSHLGRTLLQWADVNATGDQSMTPLHFAAYHGHAAIVKRLIKAGANLNATSHLGRTPLQWATERGHAGIVQLLEEAIAAA